jgi:N-acetylneuraminic acid mutarotase
MNPAFLRLPCMKHIFQLLVVVLPVIAGAQNWQQLTDFSSNERDDGTVFVIGNQAYCGLGMNAWFDCTADFQVFDLQTESWSAAVGLPAAAARQYANGFAHAGSGYVFGGIDVAGNYLNDLWKLDPVAGIWTIQQPLPGAGRAGAVCFVIGDTAYVAGGKSVSSTALQEVWAYSFTTGQWTQRTDLPFAGIWRGVAFAWHGKGVAGLGKNNQNAFNEAFYTYTPESDLWEQISGLSVAGAVYTASASIDHFAYLYGGMNAGGNYLNTFQRLDLETFEIHTLTNFPADARKGCMAFASAHAFYLTTGVSVTARLKETWKASEILAVAENQPADGFAVLPNPSDGSFQVYAPEMIHEVRIFDTFGKIIYQKSVYAETVSIQEALSPGLYVLEIHGTGFQATRKLRIY